MSPIRLSKKEAAQFGIAVDDTEVQRTTDLAEPQEQPVEDFNPPLSPIVKLVFKVRGVELAERIQQLAKAEIARTYGPGVARSIGFRCRVGRLTRWALVRLGWALAGCGLLLWLFCMLATYWRIPA